MLEQTSLEDCILHIYAHELACDISCTPARCVSLDARSDDFAIAAFDFKDRLAKVVGEFGDPDAIE